MKFRWGKNKSLLSLTAILTCSAFVMSPISAGAADGSGFAVGVKAVASDVADESVNDGIGGGLVISDSLSNGFGAELEWNRTEADVNLLGEESSYTMNTVGVYASYRTPGSLYAKVRAGYIWKQLDVEEIVVAESSVGGGVGIGYDFGNLMLEAEYTYIDKDITQASLGLFAKF